MNRSSEHGSVLGGAIVGAKAQRYEGLWHVLKLVKTQGYREGLCRLVGEARSRHKSRP